MSKKIVKVEKKKGGRPTDYTPELADRICDAISESKTGLRNICRDNPDFPSRKVIYEWLIRHKDFREKYEFAKELQADLLVEEIIEISDDSSKDVKVNQFGDKVPDKEFILRSRLRVDSRKWLASHLFPKKYGERVLNEHTGRDGGPIQHEDLTESERISRIAKILERARVRRDSGACESN